MLPGTPAAMAAADTKKGGDGQRTQAALDIIGAVGQSGGSVLTGVADIISATRGPQTQAPVVLPPTAVAPAQEGMSIGMKAALGAAAAALLVVLMRR